MFLQRLVACGLSAFLVSVVCTAQVRTDDSPRPPSDSSAPTSEPLMAKLVLTADEPALRRAWETASDRPALDIIDKTRLGSTVGTAIVFKGCAPDGSGRCDVTVDFEVTDPSGKRKRAPTAKLWTAAPIPGKLMLGSTSISLAFTTPESMGPYTVHARLTDHVSGQVVDLAAPLQVDR